MGKGLPHFLKQSITESSVKVRFSEALLEPETQGLW